MPINMNKSINVSQRYSDENDGQSESQYMDSKVNLKSKTLDARSW